MMKRQWNTFMRRGIMLLVLAAFVAMPDESYAGKIQRGEAWIPGTCNPKRKVKWSIRYSKTPYNGPKLPPRFVHVWIDFELCDPPATGLDSVAFILCAMFNLNKPNRTYPGYSSTLNAGTGQWVCTSIGNHTGPPNYHIGCDRVVLRRSEGWKKNAVDTKFEFSVDFEEADIAAPYIDLASDCPNGFSGCGSLFDNADGWLVPGDGVYPQNSGGGCDGTSSFWALNGGLKDTLGLRIGRGTIPTGNWYTMRFMDRTFNTTFQGTLTNAPVGTTVEITLPVSAANGGQQVYNYTVGTEPLDISVPVVIGPGLMTDPNEHTFFEIRYPTGSVLPNTADGIVFDGTVTADAEYRFDDGTLMYAAGDDMYGLLLQWPAEDDDPIVESESLLQLTPTTYEVQVQASDASTDVVAAMLVYTVGSDSRCYAIPWDNPAMVGTSSRFRGTFDVPEGLPISSCQVLVIDDARNITTVQGQNIVLGVADPFTAQGYALKPNYPNPVWTTTTLPFSIARREHVVLSVFDINGREISRPVDGIMEPGEHTVEFDARRHDLSTGSYYYRLTVGGLSRTRSFVLYRAPR